VHGSLVVPPTPPEPAGLDDGTAAALLDEAEDFLNSIGERVKAEVEADRRRQSARRGLGRFLRRRGDRT
jgi:hypothetical protein